MYTFEGVWSPPLIHEHERGKLPQHIDYKSMTQAELNNLPQNKISFEELKSLKNKSLLMADNHGNKVDQGYVDSVWYNKKYQACGRFIVNDDRLKRKIQSREYKGLSMCARREVFEDRSLSRAEFLEISPTDEPFFENCIITKCSKQKKLNHFENKKQKKKNYLL